MHPHSPARLLGVDLARGVAVVAMVIAHTSPSAIDLPFEYLTAPLFAMLIGVGLGLSVTRSTASPAALINDNIVRGALLFLIGVFLQRMYASIDIVLQTLGLLMVVLAPLALLLARRPRLTLALAALAYLLSPVATGLTRERLATGEHGTLARDALEWVAADPHYRLSSHLVYGLIGIALAAWLRRGGGDGPAGGIRALQMGLFASAVLVLGKLTGWGGAAYAGDHVEILATTLLAAGTIIGCTWLVGAAGPRAATLEAVIATGRMALSAYAVQVIYLWALMQTNNSASWNDNAWWILVSTIAVCVGASWAWQTVLHRPGPLETLLRLPRLLAR